MIGIFCISQISDIERRSAAVWNSIYGVINVQIKLDSVQQAELKEVMKKDRRTYTQQEIKKLFTDMLHRQYLMG